MSAISLSTPSLYAVGQDPRLEKILERAKCVEGSIRYLQLKAATLQSIDKARLDKYFEEFEVASEILLKDLVINLLDIKSSTSDEQSWLWLPPDHAADLRDFLGRLYCILKLAEGIREENLKIENTSVGSSPATLGRQPLENDEQFEPFYAHPENSPASSSQQFQQDDRHQKAILHICDELAELSEMFNFHHYRLKKYVLELRGHHRAQETLEQSPLVIEDAVNHLQLLPASPSGVLSRQESYPTREECLSLLQQDKRVLKTGLGNDHLERRRAANN